MSADPETQATEAAPKSKMKLIIIGLSALILAGGGGGYWFLFASKPKAEPEAVKKVTSFIDLKDMMIGIQPDRDDQSARPRMLRVKISLEVEDATQVTLVQPLMPRVEDIFQTYLRDLRPADIQGTAGLMALREELLRRVNMAVVPGRVEAILFKEILLQ